MYQLPTLYPVSLDGIKAAIEARKQFNTPRSLLVDELKIQYKEMALNDQQVNNLHLLLNDNTFTICTAHQPNIFTGPLYFIYKILHTIKLANHLNREMPENHFVPVYYMGSDSDLAVMKAAADILKDFGISFELTVVSAHRTPLRMVAYAKAAKDRGLKVIIAGAGGAAHLPGMVAAIFTGG